MGEPLLAGLDLLILWLALIHGANGMRTIVNDYTSPGVVQKVLKGALLLSTIVLPVPGTLVIFTFDPCPAGSPAELLPRSAPPHRRHVTSENHVETTVVDGVHYHQYDIVIVGAGGAGMRAAIEAGPGAKTAVISKLYPTRASAHGRCRAGRHGRRARERRGGQLEWHTFDTVTRAATTSSTRMGRDPREGGHRRGHRPREHGPALQPHA